MTKLSFRWNYRALRTRRTIELI